MARRNLGAGERDAAEQGGAVVQAQGVAGHGVAGQIGAQVEHTTGGGDRVVAAQAGVAAGQQAQLRRCLWGLQVDDQGHGFAGAAGVARVVECDGPQMVLTRTQADAGKAEGACGGAGYDFGHFFAGLELAVVVAVVEQHHAGVDLGRAVEHQSRGGSGQAIGGADAHVQACAKCQRWHFAVVVNVDFEAGGGAFVARQVHAAHGEIVQTGGQIAGGVRKGARTQLRAAQTGDQGGFDTREHPFHGLHPKTVGPCGGGHTGCGRGFGPGCIQADTVQGVVAVAVGRSGGAGVQLSVGIEREPDFDHLGLVEFAVVNPHEPAVGAAGLGRHHVGEH